MWRPKEESSTKRKSLNDNDIEDVAENKAKRKRDLIQCRYFLEGKCRKGGNCPYLHDPAIEWTAHEWRTGWGDSTWQSWSGSVYPPDPDGAGMGPPDDERICPDHSQSKIRITVLRKNKWTRRESNQVHILCMSDIGIHDNRSKDIAVYGMPSGMTSSHETYQIGWGRENGNKQIGDSGRVGVRLPPTGNKRKNEMDQYTAPCPRSCPTQADKSPSPQLGGAHDNGQTRGDEEENNHGTISGDMELHRQMFDPPGGAQTGINETGPGGRISVSSRCHESFPGLVCSRINRSILRFHRVCSSCLSRCRVCRARFTSSRLGRFLHLSK